MSKDKQGSKASRIYENGDEMLSGEIRSLRALAKRVAAWGDAPQFDLQVNNLAESLALEGGRGTLRLNGDGGTVRDRPGSAQGILRCGRSHPGGGGDGKKNVEKKAGAFVLQESVEEKDLQEIHAREKADLEALMDGSTELKEALQILLRCITCIAALEKEIQKS